MENTLHFRLCLAVRAGKRHRECGFNRVGRQTKIVIAMRELTIEIDTCLIRDVSGLSSCECRAKRRDGRERGDD